MIEPTGHCPFVGLKQNRAIRFASPTAEHRCYVGGEPVEIPVAQEDYCLSSGHTHCPLYMGLTIPTMQELPVTQPLAIQPGIGGWLASLPRREQRTYAVMIGLLGALLLLFLFLLLRSLLTPAPVTEVQAPTALPTTVVLTVPGGATRVPTLVATTAPTATPLPRNTATPSPTSPPPTEAIVFVPTALSTATPTRVIAFPTAVAPSGNGTSTPATSVLPTSIPVVATPIAGTRVPAATSLPATPAPATLVPPTRVPPTRAPATTVPSPPTPVPATPIPPTRVPTTRMPATPIPVPPTLPAPTPAPATPAPPTRIPATPIPATPIPHTTVPVQVTNELVTVYASDPTGGLFVPVQRTVAVENQQIARAALKALFQGPRNGLASLVLPETQILGLTIQDGTATVDLDRRPTAGTDERGLNAIVLTLTEFRSVERVQIQVKGKSLTIGGQAVVARPVVNPLNPDKLAYSNQTTTFLPLYFVTKTGGYSVRVIRMVPKTQQTAEATVRALLAGPGEYGYALRSVIPGDTQLRGIKIVDGVVFVDFTKPFINAERGPAIQTITAALTTLPNVRGVQFLVEGANIADVWGNEYARVFTRPAINRD